jgi:hypothetical protein
MKATILRYGFYAAISLIIFSFLTWLILGSDYNYELQEVFGYAGMIVALSFVYFGIRHYRNNVNNGHLSFRQGMNLGLMISLIPAIAFGLFDILYVTVLNPGFLDRYYLHIQEEMKRSLSAVEYQAKVREMESEKAMFENPAIQFLVMTLTVFLIGIIVTVISTLILRRKKSQETA